MEEKELQQAKEDKVEEVKEVEVKETEVKEVEEVREPKGYYEAKVPASYTRVIVLDKKQVDADELLIKMANILRDQLGMK